MSDEGSDAGSARLTFDRQLEINIIEEEDDPRHLDGRMYSDSPLVAEFTVINAGTAPGGTAVTVSAPFHTWEPYPIDGVPVGGTAGGRVWVGRIPAGRWEFTASLDTGRPGEAHETSTAGVDVEDPPDSPSPSSAGSSSGAPSGSPRFDFGKDGVSFSGGSLAAGPGSILYSDSELAAAFTVQNVGTGAGIAQVYLTTDDDWPLGVYTTQTLSPHSGVEMCRVNLAKLDARAYIITTSVGPVETIETGDVHARLTNVVDVQDRSDESAVAAASSKPTASSAPSSAPGASSSPAPSGAVGTGTT
jgi:hypothetical protein